MQKKKKKGKYFWLLRELHLKTNNPKISNINQGAFLNLISLYRDQ